MKNFPIKIILLIIFSYIIILNLIKFNKNNFYKKYEVFIKCKKFINKCVKGVYVKSNKINKKNKILITSIIPVYNTENKIKSSIRSIQNQNLTDIEILLVNDFSTDKSLKVIEDLKKEDPRILIINNKKNMGTLYSRSIGVLKSKGEYIFCLDNDDMFFDNDIFYYGYKISKLEHYDIVSFRRFHSFKHNFNVKKIKNFYLKNVSDFVVRQPDLGKYPISKNNKFLKNDIIIWGKSIKKNIYKKAINKSWKYIYSNFVCYNEDIIMIYVIFNIANSFKFINKYGVIHIISTSSTCFTQPKDNKIFAQLLFIDIILEFSNKNINKNFAVDQAIKIYKLYNISQFNNKNKLYAKSIIKKIINNKYIIANKKIKILSIFKIFL